MGRFFLYRIQDPWRQSFLSVNVARYGCFPISHPKCWSFLVGKAASWVPTILGNPHMLFVPWILWVRIISVWSGVALFHWSFSHSFATLRSCLEIEAPCSQNRKGHVASGCLNDVCRLFLVLRIKNRNCKASHLRVWSSSSVNIINISNFHSGNKWYCWWFKNPAPGMYKILGQLGYLLHQRVQDFFHQQYYKCNNNTYRTG